MYLIFLKNYQIYKLGSKEHLEKFANNINIKRINNNETLPKLDENILRENLNLWQKWLKDVFENNYKNKILKSS